MKPVDFCENILNQLSIGWTWRELPKIILNSPNYMLIYLKEEYYNLFDTK